MTSLKHSARKTIKPFLIICALTFGVAPMAAQTEVTPYVPGATAEGITYYLPQTELRMRVSATRVTYTPGELRPYAERYLRLSNIPKAPSTTWKIDKVEIYSVGKPDKSKVFSIKLKPRTSAPLVGLTSDGVLLSINADAPQHDDIPALPDPVVTNNALNARDYMSQEILSAGSVSKMAELTAAEIYDIRESRTALAKGEADNLPKDGAQFKLMLNSLDTQERALLQLFKGTESSESRSYEFAFTPTGDTQQVLFRFSKKLGPLDADNLAGEPVYISVKDKHTVAAPVETEKKRKETEDVRYIVPSEAEVKVYDQRNVLASGTFPIAQFGNVEHLGSALFDKKMDTQVFLDPTTGGIVKLKAPTAD